MTNLTFKRIIISAITAVLTLTLCACGGDSDDSAEKGNGTVNTDTNEIMNNEQTNTYRQISMDEAVKIMAEEHDYIILDVRTPQEFAEKHIPNAINIPNENIGTSEIPELPDKKQLILVYCRSGNRSKQASSKLVKLGYTNIVEFGGINDWHGDVVSGN